MFIMNPDKKIKDLEEGINEYKKKIQENEMIIEQTIFDNPRCPYCGKRYARDNYKVEVEFKKNDVNEGGYVDCYWIGVIHCPKEHEMRIEKFAINQMKLKEKAIEKIKFRSLNFLEDIDIGYAE